MVRFANTYGPQDWNGAETGSLLRAWPKQLPSEQIPRPPHLGEYGHYSTSSWNIGSKILSRADQSFVHPAGFDIAGQSKRITSFYRKTGVSEHRTEPGFRDTKGGGTYTEINAPPTMSPMSTFRSPFQNTASTVLTRRARESQPGGMRERAAAGPAAGPAARKAQEAEAGSVRSRRSENSVKSAPASASRFGATAGQFPGQQSGPRVDWDWDPLPMYHTCNQLYGAKGEMDPMDPKARSAGKSWSGFLTPTKLVKALQNPGESITTKM